MKVLDNWLQGNAPPQPRTSEVPRDDQVRLLGRGTPHSKFDKELAEKKVIDRDLLQRNEWEKAK